MTYNQSKILDEELTWRELQELSGEQLLNPIKTKTSAVDRFAEGFSAPIRELGADANQFRLQSEAKGIEEQKIRDDENLSIFQKGLLQVGSGVGSLASTAVFAGRGALDIAGAPISGAFSALAGGDGLSEDGLISKTLALIEAGETNTGKGFDYINRSLGGDGLSELDKKNSGVLGFEGLLVAGGAGALKGLKSAPVKNTVSNAYNSISKNVGNIQFRKADTDALEEKFNNLTSQYEGTFQLDRFNSPEIKDNFYRILDDGLNNGDSVESIKANIKTLGIDSKEVDEVFQKIEKERKISYTEQSYLVDILGKKKDIPTKSNSQIEKVIKNSKLFEAKTEKEFNVISNKIRSDNNGVKGKDFDTFLENKKIEEFDKLQESAKTLYGTLRESAKKEGLGTTGLRGDIKAEGLTKLAEEGYLRKERELVKGKGGNELVSYTFTDKGIALFKSLPKDLQNELATNSPNSFIESKKLNGVAKITPKRANRAETKRKTGELITQSEIVEIADTLLKDNDLKTVEKLSDLYKADALDELQGVELQNAIRSLSAKYDLEIDEIKAFNSIDDFKEAIKKIDEAKKDGFLKISQIKNSVAGRRNKPASIAGRLGFSTAFIKSIDKTLARITPDSFNKEITKAKNQLEKAKKTIENNKKKTKTEKEVILRLEINKYKKRELELNARKLSVDKTKTLILKRIGDLELDPRYEGVDTGKIIKKIATKQTWGKANSGPEIQKQLEKIYKEIDFQRLKNRKEYLEKKLKLTKNASGAQYSADKIRIDSVLAIKGYEKYFLENKDKLDAEVIDEFIEQVETITSRGKEALLKEKYAKSRETLGDIAEVRKSLYDKDGNRIGGIDGFKNKNKDKSSNTPKQIVKKTFGSWSSATNFIFREVDNIFNGNKKAKEIIVSALKRVHDEFEVFEEKYTRNLVDNLTALLKPEELLELGEFLTAKRRVVNENGETIWLGLDRMHYDETSSYNKKTDKYKDEPKPKGFEDMEDALWDEIKETELAGIMIKSTTNPKYKKATELWSKYHEVTAKLYQKAQVEVDNKFTEAEPHYTYFNYLEGGKVKEINNLGDNDLSVNYLDKSHTKMPVGTIKGEVILDYNPIAGLLGVGKKARHYGFMAENFKRAKGFYDGPSKQVRDLTIKEINEFSDDPNSKFTENGDEIQIDGELVNGDTEVPILRKINKVKTNEKGEFILDSKGRKVKERDAEGNVEFVWEEDTVSVDNIKGHVQGKGIKDDLNKQEQHSISQYLNKVAKGGNSIGTDGERIFNRLANHYNRLPLMGSISVFAKQGLSIIDGIGKVGYLNYQRAVKDLATDKEIGKFLDENVIEVHNRALDPIDKDVRSLKLDKNWAEKVLSKYEKYSDLTMKPIQYMDKQVYKAIWTSSLRKNLIERKILKPDEPLTVDIIKRYNKDFTDIGIEADSIASTAHPLMVPRVYNNVFQKAFFGIFTSQLNRMQIILNDVPNRYKSGDKSGAVFEATMLMASNIMETAVTLAIGKYIYSTLGITTWDGYEEDFLDLLVSVDTLNRITIGQTFWSSKLTGASSDFGVAPVFGGIGKTAEGIFEVGDALKDGGVIDMAKELGNFFSENVGGKVMEQMYNMVENNIYE